MIVIEDILEKVVNGLSEVNLGDNRVQFPVFGWGNKDELNRYLEEHQDKSYPLIWLMPNNKNYSVKRVSQRSEFIIAVNHTKEEIDLMNDQRMDLVFKTILYPLMENFLKGINQSRNATFDNTGFDVFDYPNYKTSGDNDVVHLWDALTLTIDATYLNNCKS
ncbi:hypothetical protein AAU57_11980 [Nonlabens sp. YIK11]|uniref:hypothetical protein n=1 Tax=Nonlabens sp. YIK11 TaxID=1453349 RepID=UPI0006DC3160|nr:hypothetical protein [Nonlabens sp. YIK11]KQC33967.1 hypothetical protein AAU57_11980 [Nonlabens sp. YIK11]